MSHAVVANGNIFEEPAKNSIFVAMRVACKNYFLYIRYMRLLSVDRALSGLKTWIF
jgi:hypothetical protein